MEYFFSDLHQIYYSKHLDPENNVRTLQNKVQWDIRFYFARRGGEGIATMKRSTFKLSCNPETNLTYIVKVQDEETKKSQRNRQ